MPDPNGTNGEPSNPYITGLRSMFDYHNRSRLAMLSDEQLVNAPTASNPNTSVSDSIDRAMQHASVRRSAIVIRLSRVGQRADIAAGGTGNMYHEIIVDRDHPLFSRVVDISIINGNRATLCIYGSVYGVEIPDCDWIPNIREIMVLYETYIQPAEPWRIAVPGLQEYLGVRPSDTVLDIQNGVLMSVPSSISINGIDTPSHFKSWMAVLRYSDNPALEFLRNFMHRIRTGNGYYTIRDLKIGDAVEFGSVFKSTAAIRNRWYGYVVKLTDTVMILRREQNEITAVSAGKAYADSICPPKKSLTRRHIQSLEVRPNWEL